MASPEYHGFHMLTGRTADLPIEMGRQHPWTNSVDNPTWKYYDFKVHLDLIRTSLEDFRSLEHTEAVERFYSFLEWLNGADSCLESSDCGLRPLQDNGDTQFHKRRRILGRLMVLFRREDINSYEQNFNWLLECFQFHLARYKPEFEWGAVELARFPTFFLKAQKNGFIVQLAFFAYGDDDDEVLKNLAETVSGIWFAAKEVNRQAMKWKLG